MSLFIKNRDWIEMVLLILISTLVDLSLCEAVHANAVPITEAAELGHRAKHILSTVIQSPCPNQNGDNLALHFWSDPEDLQKICAPLLHPHAAYQDSSRPKPASAPDTPGPGNSDNLEAEQVINGLKKQLQTARDEVQQFKELTVKCQQSREEAQHYKAELEGIKANLVEALKKDLAELKSLQLNMKEGGAQHSDHLISLLAGPPQNVCARLKKGDAGSHVLRIESILDHNKQNERAWAIWRHFREQYQMLCPAEVEADPTTPDKAVPKEEVSKGARAELHDKLEAGRERGGKDGRPQTPPIPLSITPPITRPDTPRGISSQSRPDLAKGAHLGAGNKRIQPPKREYDIESAIADPSEPVAAAEAVTDSDLVLAPQATIPKVISGSPPQITGSSGSRQFGEDLSGGGPSDTAPVDVAAARRPDVLEDQLKEVREAEEQCRKKLAVTQAELDKLRAGEEDTSPIAATESTDALEQELEEEPDLEKAQERLAQCHQKLEDEQAKLDRLLKEHAERRREESELDRENKERKDEIGTDVSVTPDGTGSQVPEPGQIVGSDVGTRAVSPAGREQEPPSVAAPDTPERAADGGSKREAAETASQDGSDRNLTVEESQ